MGDLPAATVPPVSDTFDAEFTTSQTMATSTPKVVVLVESKPLKAAIETILWDAHVPPSVVSEIGRALVVIVEVTAETARERVAEIRAGTRPDAAILAVGADTVEIKREALSAGALVVLGLPPDGTELAQVVRSALATDAIGLQVSNLTSHLNLQTHLATIGRLTAGLSHEIASPLAAARSNAEIARWELEEVQHFVAAPDVGDRPRAAERLREAKDALDDTLHALDRITDLLQLVRGLAQQRTPTLDRVALSVASERALRDLLPNVLDGIALERVLEPHVEVRGSGLLVGQIVTNLVTNAARAARTLPAPRVRVHAYAAGNFGVVSVRDNGPGIPPRMQEQIFEPFFTTHREQGGLGLGLALCREYALQMGARLSLESVPGRGACFRLHLPVR